MTTIEILKQENNLLAQIALQNAQKTAATVETLAAQLRAVTDIEIALQKLALADEAKPGAATPTTLNLNA